MPAEIPRPDEQTLLLDIDGTLIDANYRLTDDHVSSSVCTAQQSGWQIGLSSDSPLSLMKIWQERLGLNGSLVAEKGAIVEHEGRVIYQPGLREFFGTLKRNAQDELRSSFPKFRWWHGNPVEALRNGESIGEPGQTVIMQNEYRECSYGIFIRYINQDGSPQITPELTELVAECVRPYYVGQAIDEDLNHEYGLIIVSDRSVSKRLGTVALQQEAGMNSIGMVGNSEADFVGSDIAVHYAVANATEGYKKIADFVSEHELTRGVIDIIDQLAAAYGE